MSNTINNCKEQGEVHEVPRDFIDLASNIFSSLQEIFTTDSQIPNPFKNIIGWSKLNQSLSTKSAATYDNDDVRDINISNDEQLLFTGLGLCQVATALPFLSVNPQFKLNNLYRVEMGVKFSELVRIVASSVNLNPSMPEISAVPIVGSKAKSCTFFLK